ncbi:BrnT family toxin [Peptococcaceae bacterium]|nr:BrnT family toxin [Peptococcaceae bacterium]
MKIIGFIWYATIIEKLERKHHVQQHQVSEVFKNKSKFRFIEKGHKAGENVYAVLGQTNAGRYLTIFFVYKKDKQALILSARDMTDTERKKYRE